MQQISCLYDGCRGCCPYRRDENSCKKTIHHLFYHRTYYTGKSLRRWRNDSRHKVSVCQGLHNALHMISYLHSPPDAQQLEDEERWRKMHYHDHLKEEAPE